MFIWDFVASTVMDNLIDWFYGQLVGFLGNYIVYGIIGRRRDRRLRREA